MEEGLTLINICPTNPIKILNQHDFLKNLCVLQMILLTRIKISMLVLGLHSKDRMSTRDKANISNPKGNRGCPPLEANRTSADCVQISLGPSIQYIPLRVYHTGGFNAMQYVVLGRAAWGWVCFALLDGDMWLRETALAPSTIFVFWMENTNMHGVKLKMTCYNRSCALQHTQSRGLTASGLDILLERVLVYCDNNPL